MSETQEFIQAFRGRFTSLLRWSQLDAFWQRLRADANGGWYVYTVGESPPEAVSKANELTQFINKLNALLRQEHREDFCGIVYTDDIKNPSFIKVYDPHNLGVVCGCSGDPPLPGWIISKLRPVDLQKAPLPGKKWRHWWQRVFAG